MRIGGTQSRLRRLAPAAARAAAGVVLLAVALAAPHTSAAQRAKGHEFQPEKARALIEAAVAALGGPRYLAVTGISTSGLFTPFSKGHATIPVEFTDTLVLPDRDRTDFGKKKSKFVQTNVGETGWKFDASRNQLEKQSDAELRAFGQFVRGTIENVLRTGWRADGVKLRYVGREEVQPRQWAEVVAVDQPDGFSVEVLFDPDTKLPVRSRYHDSETNSVAEARYHQYIDQSGVQVPRIVDLYKGGVQTGRIVNEVVRLNPAVPPGHFEMPADTKSLAK